MAVFNIKATLKAMESHLSASGYPNAQVGEPKSPPSDDIAAVVFMNSTTTTELTLDTVEEIHVVTVRFYIDMLQGPEPEEIEFSMAEAVSKLTEDFLGDLQMGGEIYTIDVSGQKSGVSLTGTWGYINIGSVMFRTVDLLVPIVVVGTVTLAN